MNTIEKLIKRLDKPYSVTGFWEGEYRKPHTSSIVQRCMILTPPTTKNYLAIFSDQADIDISYHRTRKPTTFEQHPENGTIIQKWYDYNNKTKLIMPEVKITYQDAITRIRNSE